MDILHNIPSDVTAQINNSIFEGLLLARDARSNETYNFLGVCHILDLAVAHGDMTLCLCSMPTGACAIEAHWPHMYILTPPRINRLSPLCLSYAFSIWVIPANYIYTRAHTHLQAQIK
jgi:hypothetical protein